jgi:hypothetical protein
MQIQLNILDSKSADKARTFKLLVIKICLTMAWYDPIRIGIAQPTHQMTGQGRWSKGIRGRGDEFTPLPHTQILAGQEVKPSPGKGLEITTHLPFLRNSGGRGKCPPAPLIPPDLITGSYRKPDHHQRENPIALKTFCLRSSAQGYISIKSLSGLILLTIIF